MKFRCLFAMLILSASGLLIWARSSVCANESAKPAVLNVAKIWDQNKHQAFTDLMYHNGLWYCVFREGTSHLSNDGGLRVLTSSDGKAWESAALVTMDDVDLRDPKITLTPEGQLMMYAAGAIHPPREKSHQSYVWFSNDGKDWGEATPIGDKNNWMWRIVWDHGVAYGVGYECNVKEENHVLRLYKSTDGKHFESVLQDMGVKGYANESAILFEKDGTARVVLRRDVPGNSDAYLGTAKAPYTEWKWEDLGVRLGGPAALQLEDGRIVIAARKYGKTAQTALWWLDLDHHSLEEIITLPSGGDTSYPGLVYRDGKLALSYYSSHEGKTNIYFAEVNLPQK